MPTKISRTLTAKLPESERADIKEFLQTKAGGICFLCGEQMSEAADSLVVDHDKPEAEGGTTTRSNLNLVHQLCNAAKRNSPSIDVRPILRLAAFMRKYGPLLKYDGVLPHFQTDPKPSEFKDSGKQVEFKFADGTTETGAVHTETNRNNTYRYTYVDVPRGALFNDSACQPRNVKLSHISAIYADLQRNPLHEAPGCRLEVDPVGGKLRRILMFDGQHKSIASWMTTRERITAKIYLDLSAAQAVELVNSIQAKIRKLPLSPFELAAKMADEWSNKLADYESHVGFESVSEAGFIHYLPPSERTRGKQAFQAALVQDILDEPNLQFRKYVGEAAEEGPAITETAFKRKVLEQLAHLKPLEAKGDAGTELRAQERANIVRLLNSWVQFAFEPDVARADLSPQQVDRIQRVRYQASLAHVIVLIRSIFSHILYKDPPDDLLKGKPNADQWSRIEASIKRIADHPVWTADLASGAKMLAVRDALSKNQGVQSAFEGVGLTAAYAAGLDEVTAADLK